MAVFGAQVFEPVEVEFTYFLFGLKILFLELIIPGGGFWFGRAGSRFGMDMGEVGWVGVVEVTDAFWCGDIVGLD